MNRTEKLEAALRLALEYWGHRQQRYKNRHPVWVKTANDALATPPTSAWNDAIEECAGCFTEPGGTVLPIAEVSCRIRALKRKEQS